jgi:hypothetical protein
MCKNYLTRKIPIIVFIILAVFVGCNNSEIQYISPANYEIQNAFPTDGRLTITGINSTHKGHYIAADARYFDDDQRNIIISAAGAHELIDDRNIGVLAEGGAKITGNSVILRVALFETIYGETNNEYNLLKYNGNDQNIELKVWIWETGGNEINYVLGTVTANFTNGIGIGILKPNNN